MIKKSRIILNKEKCKSKKKSTCKGYASTYNVEILNSFDPELQIKGTALVLVFLVMKISNVSMSQKIAVTKNMFIYY